MLSNIFNRPKRQFTSEGVCWDWKGILYSEILSNNTIHSEKYCSQLNEFEAAIEKRYLELANQRVLYFIRATLLVLERETGRLGGKEEL